MESVVFARVSFDIECDCPDETPRYRIYVNDQLFTERTWNWTDCYLEEILQISAPPGQYQVKVKAVGHSDAIFRCKNFRIKAGAAEWVADHLLEIIGRKNINKDKRI